MCDGYGGRDTVDPVGRWFVELVQELARVSREAFDVSPLALGVERVEGHAGFAAARDAAEHDELAVGQVEVDVPQIVYCYASQLDGSLAHDGRLSWQSGDAGWVSRTRPTLQMKKRRVEPFIVGLWSTPVNMAWSDIIQMVLVEVMWCAGLENLPIRFTCC